MSSNAGGLEGWLSLRLVALSGFVLALLSAFLPGVSAPPWSSCRCSARSLRRVSSPGGAGAS
jgi:hypothetical protein